jgi:hypothetical protein
MDATYIGNNPQAQAYKGSAGRAMFLGSGWVFFPNQRAEGDNRQFTEFGVKQSELQFSE